MENEDDEEEMLYQEMEEEEAYELEEDLTDEEEYDEYEDEEYEEYEEEYEVYGARNEYPNVGDDSRSKEEKRNGHPTGIPPFFLIPGAATSSLTNHCSEKGIYAQKTAVKPRAQKTGKSVIGAVLLLISALIGYVACVD